MAFVFPNQNPFTFQWTITDADGLAVNDATVTATLYSGRSATLPAEVPGDPVEDFDGVSLDYVTDSEGVYQAEIPGTFNPEVGGDFIVVIDATRGPNSLGHWEVPALVQERVL
jgi:hypothetical protein